jgi:hypothetical protein
MDCAYGNVSVTMAEGLDVTSSAAASDVVLSCWVAVLKTTCL